MREKITRFVDSFYFPFIADKIPLQTFRYGVCGGVNMLFDMVLYFVIFHYVLNESDVNLGVAVISPQIMAFLIAFPITFFTGFWLTKNVSFQNDSSKTGIQTVKYLMVVFLNIAVKYWGIKLLVDIVTVYPSISNAIMTVITVILSYLLQKRFTFR